MTIFYQKLMQFQEFRLMKYASSVGRLRHNFYDGKTFATISVEKGDVAKAANKERTTELMEEMRQYGYLPMKGHWLDEHTGRWLIENGFWVNGISLENAVNLAAKYGQDSVIWVEKRRWDIYKSTGEKTNVGGTKFQVEPMDIALARELPFSHLKDKKDLAIRFSGVHKHGVDMNGINPSVMENIKKLGARLCIKVVPRETVTLVDNLTGKVLSKMECGGGLFSQNSFFGALRISDDIKRLWIINHNNVLDSRIRYNREFMDEFSWDPDTGEFLPNNPGELHAVAIGNREESECDNYVRGIILRANKAVAFKPYAPPAKIARLDEEEINVLNFEAQWFCQDLLSRNGASRWKFVYNVNNGQLCNMQGVRSW